MNENPIRVIRNRLGLSIEAFASACDIHPQAVLLAERGVYPHPLPKITSFLTLQGEMYPEFQDDYTRFVVSKRREKGSKLGVPTLTVEALGEPGSSPLVALRNSLGVSRMGFCKDLCVHPALELRCEQGATPSLTGQLLEALEQAGLDPPVVKELIDRQLDFCGG